MLLNKSHLQNITFLLIFALISIFFIRINRANNTSDSLWHLAIGRNVVEQKQIPNHDPFTYGSKNTSFTSTEWLAGSISYIFIKNFGFDSTLYFRTLIGILVLAFFLLAINKTIKNFLVRVLFLLIASYVLATRLQLDRPESFSFLFLAITNYATITFYLEKKISNWLFFVPIIFLLWPNIHAYTVIGALQVGTIFALDVMQYPSIKKGLKISRAKVFFVLCILAVLVQPIRFFYFLTAISASQFNITELEPLATQIGRLKSLIHPTNFNQYLLFLSEISPARYIYFAILITSIIQASVYLQQNIKGKINARDAVFYISYFLILLLPLLSNRLISFSLLMLLPVYPLFFNPKSTWKKIVKTPVLVGAIAVVLTFISLSILSNNLLLDRGNTVVYINPLTKEPFTTHKHQFAPDIKAHAFVAKYLDSKRLFTFQLGHNYFIWFNPQIKVFSDVMVEYRTLDDARDEETIRQGVRGWQDLVERYKIDTIINSTFGFDSYNNTPVQLLPNWHLVYVTGNSAIYAKDTVIKNMPLDLSKILPKANSPIEIAFANNNAKTAKEQLEKLVAFDNTNVFARIQLILYYLRIQKDTQQAERFIYESKQIAPSEPIFTLLQALTEDANSNCQNIEKYKKAMTKESQNDQNYQIALQINLLHCK